MKIKNIIMLSVFSFSVCNGISAQKGSIECRFNLGYGFPTGLQTSSNFNITTTTISVIDYSLGAGFNVAANGTYWLTKNIGAGLDLNYLFGTPVTARKDNG